MIRDITKYIFKIFLRRYYPYQVQGFGAFRLSRQVTAPLIFYAVYVSVSPTVTLYHQSNGLSTQINKNFNFVLQNKYMPR